MTIDEILQACCFKSEGATRYAMSAPWVADGYRLATDSKIAVRVKTTEPATVPPADKKYPDVLGLPWGEHSCMTYPIPPADKCKPKSKPCAECIGGKRPDRIRCEECNGEGSRECDMGHEHDCKECDARGYIEVSGEKVDCKDCGGTGRVPNPYPVTISSKLSHGLADNYCRLLLAVGCTSLDALRGGMFRAASPECEFFVMGVTR